jgi:hypothetical protein
VLAELQQRGWTPPEGEVLDWGCGSGVAHRAFLDQFGARPGQILHVWDRSALAIRFAADKARSKYPGLQVQTGIPTTAALVLVSHVLTELEPTQTESLVRMLVERATSVIWVEPGNYESSLALIAVRERLREHFNVVAPCTHAMRCGVLAPGNEPHWCHHFAAPPREVFIDSNWGKFARFAGIDLRSLPLSFLVVDKRPVAELATGALRLIGRPRLTKPYALVMGCDASGLRERKISKRHLPEAYRLAKKGSLPVLQVSPDEGEEIRQMNPLVPPSLAEPEDPLPHD